VILEVSEAPGQGEAKGFGLSVEKACRSPQYTRNPTGVPAGRDGGRPARLSTPMELRLGVDHGDTLVVVLREGSEETTIAVRPVAAGVRSLLAAVDAAMASGYGECFWPAPTGGQYWWMFRRDHESLETIAMWTRGGATGWEHRFRATDAALWLRDRLGAEIARLGLDAATRDASAPASPEPPVQD
jgi:hypothetical protein